MTDKEQLELAAKAAGIKLWTRPYDARLYIDSPMRVWNPLTDDGDALRLAVKLGLMIDVINDATGVQALDVAWCIEQHKGDQYAATRRAIVRAAAEIGKAM